MYTGIKNEEQKQSRLNLSCACDAHTKLSKCLMHVISEQASAWSKQIMQHDVMLALNFIQPVYS
jgi:hypothetical protein